MLVSGVAFGQSLTGVTVLPNPVLGGNSVTGTVTLSAAATTAVSVSLTSQIPSYVTVPASVSIAAGASSATFPVTTKAFRQNYSDLISAKLSSTTRQVTLNLIGDSISSISLVPTHLNGGATATGTITLLAAAPAGGWVVSLVSAIPSYVSVPSSVTVAAGATTATFTATTKAFRETYTDLVTAKDLASTKAQTLTVNNTSVDVVKVSPTTVAGGASTTGAIGLYADAPTGGWTVNLKSQFPSFVTVPSSVTVAAGSRTAIFPITTKSNRETFLNSITASDPLNSAVGELTVDGTLPPVVQIVSLAANYFAFDPATGKLWVTVNRNGGDYANSVVGVDPATGKIGPVVKIGVEPNLIAVTSDGQYAYVNIPEDGSIRQINLKTAAIGSSYAIGVGGIFDLESVPGSDGAYVVVTDPTYGVNTTVYDGLTPRSGTGAGGYRVLFAGNTGVLYGDGHNSLFRDVVTSSAIDWTDQTGLDVTGCVWGGKNLLYTQDAAVIDPVTKLVVEDLPTTDLQSNNFPAVNDSENRIYYLTSDSSGNTRIVEFDETTYSELPYFTSGNISGALSHLVACGNHTIAFLSNNNQGLGIGLVRNLK